MEAQRVYVAESFNGLRLFRRSTRGRTPLPKEPEFQFETVQAPGDDEVSETPVRVPSGGLQRLALK